MPGPLPEPTSKRRRRNAPTIPTTSLPAAGFDGPYPDPPEWVELGAAAGAWWTWAWRTPSAAGWSAGDLVVIARRATLEDDLAAIRVVGSLDVAELLEIDPNDRTAELDWLIRRLHALAAGKLAIAREIRELEDRLGLTPKGMAALRWTVVADKEPDAKANSAGIKGRSKSKAPVRRLRAVESPLRAFESPAGA
ncbi:MAG: hypothetical protein LC798_05480 [Chloroflexi bacterium]|nr:hypothetical protein [Chloroflexota bacterium]